MQRCTIFSHCSRPDTSLNRLSPRPRCFVFVSERAHNQMTVTDIMIAYRVKYLKDGVLEGVPTTIVDSYPNLIALHDSIVAEPKIAAFIAKHAN